MSCQVNGTHAALNVEQNGFSRAWFGEIAPDRAQQRDRLAAGGTLGRKRLLDVCGGQQIGGRGPLRQRHFGLLRRNRRIVLRHGRPRQPLDGLVQFLENRGRRRQTDRLPIGELIADLENRAPGKLQLNRYGSGRSIRLPVISVTSPYPATGQGMERCAESEAIRCRSIPPSSRPARTGHATPSVPDRYARWTVSWVIRSGG